MLVVHAMAGVCSTTFSTRGCSATGGEATMGTEHDVAITPDVCLRWSSPDGCARASVAWGCARAPRLRRRARAACDRGGRPGRVPTPGLPVDGLVCDLVAFTWHDGDQRDLPPRGCRSVRGRAAASPCGSHA